MTHTPRVLRVHTEIEIGEDLRQTVLGVHQVNSVLSVECLHLTDHVMLDTTAATGMTMYTNPGLSSIWMYKYMYNVRVLITDLKPQCLWY